MSPQAPIDAERLRALLGAFDPVRFDIVARRPHDLDWGSAVVERLDLSGPTGPVRAYLTGPARPWTHVPAVVYVHAHGNRYAIGASELVDGRPSLVAPPYGKALAGAGIAALCIDLPCFGERPEPAEPALSKSHLWAGRTLFGAMLAELEGAVNLLAGEAGVDARRVGAMGLSMGATLSYWLAALDRRIAAVAHLCCFADLATLIASGAHDLHGHYMTVPGLASAATTGAIAGLVAPRPHLVCLGADDPLTPTDAVATGLRDLAGAYAAAGAAAALEVLIEPGSGHTETARMRAAVLAFFTRTLGAPVAT